MGGWRPSALPCGTCYPCRYGARGGACPQRCRFGWRWRHPAGGLPALSPAYPAFSFVFAPIPPAPFPAVWGGILLNFAGGSAPGTPGIKPLAALTEPAKQVPGATESLRFNAKPTERFPYEQCRQPRRGGTGGEELRRLRWSSPPGQVEPVPSGHQDPPHPKKQIIKHS